MARYSIEEIRWEREARVNAGMSPVSLTLLQEEIAKAGDPSECCGLCKFFLVHPSWSDRGLCVRNAPHAERGHAEVMARHYCGEFKEKKKEAGND